MLSKLLLNSSPSFFEDRWTDHKSNSRTDQGKPPLLSVMVRWTDHRTNRDKPTILSVTDTWTDSRTNSQTIGQI